MHMRAFGDKPAKPRAYLRRVITFGRAVPIIASFFGIVIRMYSREHLPPHFHAEYQGQEADFALDGELLRGKIQSKRARQLIGTWALLNHAALTSNWARIEAKQPLERIPPLD